MRPLEPTSPTARPGLTEQAAAAFVRRHGSGALKSECPCIDSRELLVDGSNDPALFGGRGHWDDHATYLAVDHSRVACATHYG